MDAARWDAGSLPGCLGHHWPTVAGLAVNSALGTGKLGLVGVRTAAHRVCSGGLWEVVTRPGTLLCGH